MSGTTVTWVMEGLSWTFVGSGGSWWVEEEAVGMVEVEGVDMAVDVEADEMRGVWIGCCSGNGALVGGAVDGPRAGVKLPLESSVFPPPNEPFVPIPPPPIPMPPNPKPPNPILCSRLFVGDIPRWPEDDGRCWCVCKLWDCCWSCGCGGV
jgi:hypothetical protein